MNSTQKMKTNPKMKTTTKSGRPDKQAKSNRSSATPVRVSCQFMTTLTYSPIQILPPNDIMFSKFVQDEPILGWNSSI